MSCRVLGGGATVKVAATVQVAWQGPLYKWHGRATVQVAWQGPL